MKFTRKDRQDFDRANKLKGDFSELLGRNCDFCKEQPWAHDLIPKDTDALIYISSFSCSDDFALACEDCFKQFFTGYPCTDESLGY